MSLSFCWHLTEGMRLQAKEQIYSPQNRLNPAPGFFQLKAQRKEIPRLKSAFYLPMFTAVLHALAAKLCGVLVGSGDTGHTVV